MNVLAELQSVGRTFGHGDTAVVALHDVTFTIVSGDRIALSGASGSGKSTLIHLLAGLDRPTRGTVTWPGLDARRQLPSGIWEPEQIGVVFQNESLVPALTGLENVALPLLLAGIPLDTAEHTASQALHRLKVDTIGNQLPDELSGGQAQRLAVARVLASRPGLILADEPTGRLEHEMAEAVIDALFEVADEIGAGLVVATHDARIISRFESRWRMEDGTVNRRTPRVDVDA